MTLSRSYVSDPHCTFSMLILHRACWALSQNTQSGTQWDGLKHFGTYPHNVFYTSALLAENGIGLNRPGERRQAVIFRVTSAYGYPVWMCE